MRLSPPLSLQNIFIVLAMLTAAFACSDTAQPGRLIDTGTNGASTPDAGDTDLGDTSHIDADDGDTDDADEAWTDPDENTYVGPEDFEKPGPDSRLSDRGSYLSEEAFSGSGFFSMSAREHMRRQAWSGELWLYEDEYFVMDFVYARHEQRVLPLNYELAVVHQGEHLPFRYVEVNSNEDWPTIDEIESWEDEKFGYSDSFYLENGVPENMTIVIPPDAFPEKGAYNVTVMFQPAWEADPEQWMLRQITTWYVTFTVYVGSELFLNDGSHIPRGEEFATEIDGAELDAAVNRTQGNFLAPPTEVYDWKATDDPTQRDLGEVLETNEAEITLELHTTGFLFMAFDNRHLDTLYYVLQDFEVVDKFVLNPDFGMHAVGWLTMNFGGQPVEGGKGYIVPIDIELPEDKVTTLQVVGIPNPFKRHDIDNRRRGMDSNGLLLRYTPD